MWSKTLFLITIYSFLWWREGFYRYWINLVWSGPGVLMIYLRSGDVFMIYLRSGCVSDILTIGVCLWYSYDRVCLWYTYDPGVFICDILTMRVCLWYTYDQGVFISDIPTMWVCLIYLRCGCAYNVLLMYLWCSYDVNLRCFANSLYSAQYTITTLSPSLYVFFTYPAIRNIS